MRFSKGGIKKLSILLASIACIGIVNIFRENRQDKVGQKLSNYSCCVPFIPGARKITFPDGDQVRLIGLDEVMNALYTEGMSPDDPTAAEMIRRLRKQNNISDSPSVQALYEKALLSEYRRFWKKKNQ